jgi:hypothetical protein
MFNDLLTSLAKQWKLVWEAFGAASPLANALQIIVTAIAFIGGTRLYVSRRLRDKDGQISDLQEDLEHR